MQLDELIFRRLTMKFPTHLAWLTFVGAGVVAFSCLGATNEFPTTDLRESVIQRLCAARVWSPAVAEAYWTVNQVRLEATATTDPKLVDAEIDRLSALPSLPKLQRLLEDEPEASGLALLAIDKGKLAAAIADAPKGDQGVLVASYLFCTNPHEVDQWSEAVTRHAPIIVTFQRRCAALPYQGLFSYLTTMRVPEARRIYGEWLDNVLAPEVLNASDDALSSRLDFVASAGGEVRKKLEADASFRQDFPIKIWPQLRESILRVAGEQAHGKDIFYLCGSESTIWDFFRRDDAPVLFHNAGMDAVTLFSDHAVSDPGIRKTMAALWSKGILDLPRRLAAHQDNTHFQALVGRLGENDWGLLNAACLSLDRTGNDFPREVSYLDSLSVSALRKELHPQEPSMLPGASLVSLVDKFIDGRRVNASDWIGAGMDTADLVCLVTTLGGSEIGTEAARAATKKALQQTLRTEAEESMKKLAGRTVRQLGSDVSEEEWTQAMARQALLRLPEDTSVALVKHGVVDITTPVKAAFEISRRLGLNREYFKLLTGLEARVFMRADGRVFINLTNAALAPSPAARYLTHQIEEEAKDLAAGPAVRQQIEEWQQNVSAWWSGLATGQIYVPAMAPVAR